MLDTDPLLNFSLAQAGVLFPSDAATLIDYDAAGRPATIAHHGAASAVLSSFAMTYDPPGNVDSISEPARMRSFGYDELERLVSETEAPGPAGLRDSPVAHAATAA